MSQDYFDPEKQPLSTEQEKQYKELVSRCEGFIVAFCSLKLRELPVEVIRLQLLAYTKWSNTIEADAASAFILLRSDRDSVVENMVYEIKRLLMIFKLEYYLRQADDYLAGKTQVFADNNTFDPSGVYFTGMLYEIELLVEESERIEDTRVADWIEKLDLIKRIQSVLAGLARKHQQN